MKQVVAFVVTLLLSVSALAGINVNSATANELAKALKGIGPKKGQAIVDYCQKNACNKPEDLLKVKGIGIKTLEKIRSELIFDDGEDETAKEGE